MLYNKATNLPTIASIHAMQVRRVSITINSLGPPDKYVASIPQVEPYCRLPSLSNRCFSRRETGDIYDHL